MQKNWQKIDKKYVWHPFTQMQDWEKDDICIIELAKGNYLYDTNGKKYLDGVSSLWVTLHGHNHPTINRYVNKQLKKLDHSTMLGLSNTPAVELAEKLIEIAPKGLSRVFYSDAGSTAMEIALKIAYQFWQQQPDTEALEVSASKKKTKFLTLKEAYHGDTIGSVSLGGMDLFHAIYKPLLFKTIQLPTPYHCYGNKPTLKESIAALEKAFKKYHKELAGFIIEPLVQGAAGIYTAPKGYLKAARALCTKYNVLMICDEVAVGFGRTGKMFACEQEGVTPDIMAIAKGISGGYLPLAATLTTEHIYNSFKGTFGSCRTFYHGHTYTGNPLACAAALGSLEVFKKEKTLEKLQPKIQQLARELQRFNQLTVVKDIRQCGFIAAIELGDFSYAAAMGHKVCKAARARGLIIRPLGNNIVFMPPLSLTSKEITWMLKVIYECIEDVCLK